MRMMVSQAQSTAADRLEKFPQANLAKTYIWFTETVMNIRTAIRTVTPMLVLTRIHITIRNDGPLQ